MENRSDRGRDGYRHADVAVEQQRERHHAEAERERREEEADGIADNDELVAFRSGEHPLYEVHQLERLIGTEIRFVNGLGNGQPNAHQRQQEKAKRGNRLK